VILGVAGALVLQSTVIVVLLLERRRRRAAERGQRLLAARLITAQEDERTRIARDLHDDACQRLALMAIELDELAQPAADSGAFLGARVHALADSARGLSADVRRIAYELHPASLDQFGLVPAVRRFAEELGARNGIAIEIVDSDWPKGPLPRDVSLVLYRVTQEALRNVAEHSGAPEARVVFRGRSGGVAVVVSDKGRGFDVEAPANERRLGLAGMRERLGLLGGRLRIESAPGAGATVEAWVPNPPALPMTADAAPSLDVLR
jgi:signal transduction histidine kinase